MVVGQSHSGKFSFIRFLFKYCFDKDFVIDDEEKTFRTFNHVIVNGRRNERKIQIVHSKGYEEGTGKKWYKTIKANLKERMENYSELRKYFYKEKSLSHENIKDNRIHICLYFVKGKEIPTKELIYISKLSKYVNIVPILVEDAKVERFNFEKIKLNAKKQLVDNNIEWFDL